MEDKDALLDEIQTVLYPKKELNFLFYLYVMSLIIFVAMFSFPKVYIQQQIYFTSRDIAKLKGEHDTLKEENRLIHASVESIKFKNQILDTLF